jgi:hypothetical protein
MQKWSSPPSIWLKRLLLWTLAGTLLGSSEALAEPVPQGVAVGVGSLNHTSFARPAEPLTTVEVSYERASGQEGPWRHLHVGGGLRLAMPTGRTNFPVEAFARAELRTGVGVWEPAAGFELGLSRAAFLTHRVRIYWELFEREDALLGPLYMAAHAAPLRFRWGRFVLGGPELRVGPTGPPFGGVMRVQIGWGRLEVQL